MPIEIRELNIKVHIEDSGGGQNTPGGASPGGDPEARQALVEEVVEKVLEILKEKNER